MKKVKMDLIIEELKIELSKLIKKNSKIDFLSVSVHAPIKGVNKEIWSHCCFQTEVKDKKTNYSFTTASEMKEKLEQLDKKGESNEN